MVETPRIRLDDKNDIQILVCHLIYALGCPLSREQLLEISSYEDAVNYFDMSAALDDITDRLCTSQEINGSQVFSNTALGVKAAREFESTLPMSLREKLFDEAVRVYTRDAIRRDCRVEVRYAKKNDGRCTLGITVRDETCGREKYFLKINTDSAERADEIKNRIKASPQAFEEYLDKYFE